MNWRVSQEGVSSYLIWTLVAIAKQVCVPLFSVTLLGLGLGVTGAVYV